MVQNESEADRASASKRMLGLLDGLKRTSSGIVIYDQIARLVEEQEGVQAKVDHTYAALLHLLLKFVPPLASAWVRERAPIVCACCGAVMKIVRTRIPPTLAGGPPTVPVARGSF